jgi:hypothetical protein
MSLDEMQSEREIPSDYADLLVSWISGQDVGAIASSLSDEVDLQSLSPFIEDVFSYRMPWGVAGYATIAKAVLADPDDAEPAGIVVSLPAMMKFGVSIPEASWAMSAGIPTRSLAMQIAREFLAEELDGASEFRRWLGRQGIDASLSVSAFKNHFSMRPQEPYSGISIIRTCESTKGWTVYSHGRSRSEHRGSLSTAAPWIAWLRTRVSL